jgi:hypothetical protein
MSQQATEAAAANAAAAAAAAVLQHGGAQPSVETMEQVHHYPARVKFGLPHLTAFLYIFLDLRQVGTFGKCAGTRFEFWCQGQLSVV